MPRELLEFGLRPRLARELDAVSAPSALQQPTLTTPVSVVVPGRQQVARTISATGQLAARYDMPIGVPGEGGKIVSVLVEAFGIQQAFSTRRRIVVTTQETLSARMAGPAPPSNDWSTTCSPRPASTQEPRQTDPVRSSPHQVIRLSPQGSSA